MTGDIFELQSFIKIEEHKLQNASQSKNSFESDIEALRKKFEMWVYRRLIKIECVLKDLISFSDPAVLLERISVGNSSTDDLKGFYENRDESVAACDLAKIGNKNVPYNDPHTCYICKKIYASRRKLTIHLERIHRKAPAMSCDHCPKTFTGKVSLTLHMVSHCKVTEFMCDFCGYKPKFKSCLVKHMSIHGSKTKCKLCGKDVSSLIEHLRTHKPKKMCPICCKMLSSRKLDQHLKTHGERALKCENCVKTFATRENLRQ